MGISNREWCSSFRPQTFYETKFRFKSAYSDIPADKAKDKTKILEENKKPNVPRFIKRKERKEKKDSDALCSSVLRVEDWVPSDDNHVTDNHVTENHVTDNHVTDNHVTDNHVTLRTRDISPTQGMLCSELKGRWEEEIQEDGLVGFVWNNNPGMKNANSSEHTVRRQKTPASKSSPYIKSLRVKFREEQRRKTELDEKKQQAIAEKKNALLLKDRQRKEIYALNKAMKELEESRYQEYCRSNKPGNESQNTSKHKLGAV